MIHGVNRPLWLSARYFLKQALKLPFYGMRGFRVEGGERLPQKRRPLILVANHAAFIDSVYLILAVRPRFTICGAKPRLFRSVPLRMAMALANILKVDEHAQYLRDCRDLLAAGEVLLIYPEMGRFPERLGAFQTWAAEVALANKAPLLPCYLYGTTRSHQGPPRLLVGNEIEPRGTAEDLTVQLRAAVIALTPKDPRETKDHP